MTGRWQCRWLFLALLWAGAGCTLWSHAPALPHRNSVVLDQLWVYSDLFLPQHHRLLDELNAQRKTLAGKLALPTSDEPVYVYLFSTADDFRRFVHKNYPEFPSRRAFFVESDTRLMVYAYWGDRVAEDLRHEVAHGYLHSVVPRIPLWLDEGLAEYFEVPQGQCGLNQPHVAELAQARSRGWEPNLRRLEQLATASDMNQIDYAEAWTWVHFLLETTPERRQLLHAYLQSLRQDEVVGPLSPRLREMHLDYERKLVDYLTGLIASGPAAMAAAK